MAALVARTAALGRARFHVLVSSAAVRALHGAAAVAPSALTPPAPAAVAAWLATGAPPAAVEDAGCAYTPEWRQRSMIGDEAGEAAVMEDGVAGGEAIQAMNRNAREGTKANHGKRPCSNRRRKRDARKRLSDHPFLPLKSKRKKGYDM